MDSKQLYNRFSFYSIILFLLWPLAAFLLSLRRVGSKYSNKILFLFYSVFGFSYIITNDSIDSSRHAGLFEKIAQQPFSDFFDKLYLVFTLSANKPDLFLDFLNFILSRITYNPAILFVAMSTLIGWMLVVNLKKQYKVYQVNKNFTALLFLFFLLALLPPSRLLSFRHYFALLVFVYGLYNYFDQQKLKYLLLTVSSIFIHFGFAILLPMVVLFIVFKDRYYIYFGLIVLAFLFQDQAISLLVQYGLELGEGKGVADTLKGYTHGQYLDRVAANKLQRRVILDQYVTYTSYFFLISMLFFYYTSKVKDRVVKNLFSISLIIFAALLFLQEMESFYGRFSLVFHVLCCFFFIRIFTINNYKKLWSFNALVIGFGMLTFIIQYRIMFEYLDALWIAPVLPFQILFDSNMTVLQLLKGG